MKNPLKKLFHVSEIPYDAAHSLNWMMLKKQKFEAVSFTIYKFSMKS